MKFNTINIRILIFRFTLCVLNIYLKGLGELLCRLFKDSLIKYSTYCYFFFVYNILSVYFCAYL